MPTQAHAHFTPEICGFGQRNGFTAKVRDGGGTTIEQWRL